MLTRSVDGKTVALSPQEEAAVRAEWAKADGLAQAEIRKRVAKEKRILALEKVLERLISQNADIPEAADYLASK